MILRFSKNQKFLKKFLNGPIRKVIMSKVKFGDLRLPPVLAIPDLVIFRPKNRKKNFFIFWLRMTQFVKKSDKKWNLTTFDFFCVSHPRLSHFQAENHRNVKYFKCLLVTRMMLYGYKTFMKSLKQVHMTSKRATNHFQEPRLDNFKAENCWNDK